MVRVEIFEILLKLRVRFGGNFDFGHFLGAANSQMNRSQIPTRPLIR